MNAAEAEAFLPVTNNFLESVLRLEPRVAAFDCDGTLWSGDAGSAFMHWSFESGLLSHDATAWLTGRYNGYPGTAMGFKLSPGANALCGYARAWHRCRESPSARGEPWRESYRPVH